MMDNAKLEAVLRARLPGFERLDSCDRLSAGASRETYRLQVVMHGAARKLALRRAEGEGVSAMSAGPGLGGEAKLFAAARDAGVPGPEVLLVLQPEDGLGAGFFMEWICGETLGGKIAQGAGVRRSKKDAGAAVRGNSRAAAHGGCEGERARRDARERCRRRRSCSGRMSAICC